MKIKTKKNKNILSALIIAGFLFLAFGSDDTKGDKESKITTDCSNSKGSYSSGYASGELCKLLGDYSSCESYVEKHNYELGRNVLTASECFCEGFNDGRNGKTEKYKNTNNESYSGSDINTLRDNNNTIDNNTTIDDNTSPNIPNEPNTKQDELESEENLTEINSNEIMASFKGGDDALQYFLMNNVHYPEICKANEVTAEGLIEFIVEPDGSISEGIVKELKTRYSYEKVGKGDYSEMFSDELKLLLKKMPRWNPAIRGGIPVRYKVNVPVRWTLD